jgi:hypothetical protein
MAKRKQRGNGEGSIYEHKRDGRKVGYRGRTLTYAFEASSSSGAHILP